MPLTNAEKQARHRARIKARLAMLPPEPRAGGIAVRTPDGDFPSLVAAAAHFGVTRQTVAERIARGVPGWEKIGENAE